MTEIPALIAALPPVLALAALVVTTWMIWRGSSAVHPAAAPTAVVTPSPPREGRDKVTRTGGSHMPPEPFAERTIEALEVFEGRKADNEPVRTDGQLAVKPKTRR